MNTSAKLQSLIDSLKNGETLNLNGEDYYLDKRIIISGKKDVVIDGGGANITTKYINSAHFSESVDAFLITDCEGLQLKNIYFDTDVPANVTATVKEILLDEKALVLEVDDVYNMKGNELFLSFNAIDDEGTPYRFGYYQKHPDPNIITVVQDEVLCASTYWGAKYDYLGNNTFKVYFEVSSFGELEVGNRLCIRHTMYGPSVIVLKDSNDTVLKNITMYATPGMGIMVFPRCNNLTIDGVKMIKKDGSHSLMACNCDGIHLTGAMGKFIMKNCEFDGMGHDALNIHTIAGTCTDVDLDERKIKCNYCKKSPDGKLKENWCAKGDTIKVFDPITMQNTGTFTVANYSNGYITYENLQGELKPKDVMQNHTLTVACDISDCEIKNTRSRGFVIQTDNVEIKNSKFFGLSNAAVKVACCFGYWYEVGPATNFYMHDNIIEKCAYIDVNSPGIGVFTKHDGNDEKITGLHKNIKIENNTFRRMKNNMITVSSSDNVEVHGNRFVSRGEKEIPAVKFISCRKVTEKDNLDI